MLTNALSLICLALAFISSIQVQAQQGCSASLNTKPSQQYSLYRSSGNQNLDNFVLRDLNVLRQYFQINPAFYFFNDSSDPNAIAMPTVENPTFPSGTIIFGYALLKKEFATAQDGTTIPLIMAHEAAHILDYKRGLLSNYPTSTKELFADYMAGVFLRYRSIMTSTNSQAVLYSFFSKGDYGFYNPDHHGTPDERVKAVLAGYNWLRQVDRPGVKISLEQGINSAMSYLGVSRSAATSRTPGSSRSSTSSANASSRVMTHYVTATNTPINGGFLYEGEYTARNISDKAIHATIKLPYGYYRDCINDASNFIEQGYEILDLDLDPHETKTFSMRKELIGQCAGVSNLKKEATYTDNE